MGAVFSNLGATAKLLIDPIFLLTGIVYVLAFAFSGLLLPNKMPYSLILPFVALLMFSYLHVRRCQKVTKHQFFMGLVTYILHRIMFLILGLFPLTKILKFIPYIGTIILGFVSLYASFFLSSVFYIC